MFEVPRKLGSWCHCAGGTLVVLPKGWNIAVSENDKLAKNCKFCEVGRPVSDVSRHDDDNKQNQVLNVACEVPEIVPANLRVQGNTVSQ